MTKPTADFPRQPARDWAAVDRRLNLPSDQQLRSFARQMDAQHAGKPSTVVLAPDYRLKGLWCERHFARVLQVPMPLRLLPHGNRRVGFKLDNGWTVDVIGRRPPKGAAYPDLTRRADARGRVGVLVLVSFHGWDSEPEVVGWEHEVVVLRDGVLGEFKPGVPNHTLAWRALRPISELAAAHAPNHPLAAAEARPFYWAEGRTVVSTPDAEVEPGVVQTSLFGRAPRDD